MYQQYRRQQKTQGSKGAKIVAILFIIAVIGGGLWYLSQIGAKVEESESQIVEQKTESITDNWYVGRKVTLNGELASIQNEIAYTHTLTTDKGEVIKMFSSARDISSYQGQVFLQGTVAKFDGKEYIVDISAIGTSETDLETISLPTSSSTTIIPTIGLKIDLSNRSDITYSNSGTLIILNAAGFSGNVKIEGFRCETGFPEKDCDTLEKTFTDGSFVSAGGMTYSKGVNGTRFAKNSAGAGYRVTTDSDAMLYKVSSVLIPINENYIKSLLSQAQKLCTTITTLSKTTNTKESLSSWKITLDGKGNGGAVGQCIIRITFAESGESIALDKQTGSSSTTNTGSTSSAVVPNTDSTGPTITATGLVFTSTRGGYSIIYPSAKIMYDGINIQEDLGIDKLNCYIRIDIKDYKDRDNDTVGPGVSIYECTSKESSETLSSKAGGYIFKTSTDGTKLFFIKVQNSAWDDFAGKIKIQ